RWVQDGGLRDVEIFNADGHPVPFARIAVAPVTTSSEHSASLPVLELPASKTAASNDLRLVIDRDASGRLRRIDAGDSAPPSTTSRDWVADASAFDRPIESLVLSWSEPASGVVARFAVDASEDLQNWHNAASATVLLLEQQGAKLERRDIALGGVKAKYLRLRRLDDGAAIGGLHVEAHTVERGETAPARLWIDAAAAETPADPKVVARFDYTLPAALPVETARIELASDNALAPLTLSARATDTTAAPWLRAGGLTAFRLRQGDETLRNGDIDVRVAERLRAFRIESTTAIAERPHLALAYRPDSLVFLAEGRGPYRLAAGSVHARHADYPIEPALASLRSTLGKDWQPPLAALGRGAASGGDAALTTPPAPVPWRRWLLWAILVGGALVIVVMALGLLRNAKPPE
ncbi:MAG TPA: DUF3999 family protein, partial [Rhodanobacteraceae bacterium]|nr:DUF3999 family protein [Rhodanobacteraceae bacterium]